MQSIRTKPSWMPQVLADLARHEGFRQYAYPDPLSKIGRKYSAAKYRWGFRPARQILAELGLDAKDGFPWTVGYGFTRGVNVDSQMSKQQGDRKLEEEVYVHIAGLEKLAPDYRTGWPLFAQTVAINMIFNMGYDRIKQFGQTFNLLNANNWAAAGSNLRKSLWFKQVGARAVELVTRLETGSIDPKHRV